MTLTPILHHHDPSPFAEKIRKTFGIKGISWQSAQIPMVMPKPDLTALTGGYRGTPVLQIGADIFCDSRRIIAEIERRAPEPGLFTSGPLVNFGLQHWSDDALFPPGAALSMFENAEHLPQAVLDDRKDYFTNLDFSQFSQDAAHFRAQLRAHFALMNDQLKDGRAFLCGATPQWSDIGAWMNIFMAANNIPSANDVLAKFENLSSWRDRMNAFGEGERTDLPPQEALAIARSAEPEALSHQALHNDTVIAMGAAVEVSPADHPETRISGMLRYANDENIVIGRKTDALGDIAVHFPRIGYRLDPAMT